MQNIVFNSSDSEADANSGITNILPGTAHISVPEEYSGYYVFDALWIKINEISDKWVFFY